jgi:hypothetical protein
MRNAPPIDDEPEIRTPRDHTGMLIAAVVLAAASWFGLYQVVTTMRPLVGPRFAFFLLLMIAISCTVIPFVRYLNVRFTMVHQPLPSSGVIVRQSVWVGLYVVMCAWLQIPRVLSLPVAFFLALALIVIEIFIRSREVAYERATEE